jgi:hypothetical protein
MEISEEWYLAPEVWEVLERLNSDIERRAKQKKGFK